MLLKYFLMKRTNFFYHLLVVFGMCLFMFCGGGDNAGSAEEHNASDSSGVNSDSMNAAHHNDPSTAYPQPPVTGSAIDSSRVKDTLKK